MPSFKPAPVDPSTLDKRERLQLDLSPSVKQLVEHVSDVLGMPQSQVAYQALLRALPDMVSQADNVRKRAGELNRERASARR